MLRVDVLLDQFTIQEDYYTCDVIDCLLFLFPDLSRASNDSISSSFCLTLFIVSLCDLCYVLDCHWAPDAVRGKDQNLVFLFNAKVAYLWLMSDTEFAMSVGVPDGPAHR